MARPKEISTEIVDVQGSGFDGDFELSDEDIDFVARLFLPFFNGSDNDKNNERLA